MVTRKSFDLVESRPMCGILGSIVPHGRTPGASHEELEALRDLMTARGPDGAGSWHEENVALAHRRLAILDPGPAGAQPMHSQDGRWVLVYNGELYNDAELRRELGYEGISLRTRCDTETVVEAIARWGVNAFGKMRGMFALAAWDRRDRRLLMARDPLGVKPLYWFHAGQELVFASDPRSVVGHPSVDVAPDWRGISAYLTTLSSTRGQRTLFEGVSMLAPGTWMSWETHSGRLAAMEGSFAPDSPVDGSLDAAESAELLHDALGDSVRRQLVSDVPLCSLLSGGIDSVSIASLALDHRDELWSYCAGSSEADGDVVTARDVAEEFGIHHASALVEREDFLADWTWMIHEGGLPLSTPNEVAIHRVSRRLAADGCKVTLSGEAADELLAGYEAVMRAAEVFEQAPPAGMCGGRFQLEAAAWIPSSLKPNILAPEIWSVLENDDWLINGAMESFRNAKVEAGPEADRLDPHLRYLRRWNLTCLLERLDRSTMLASVEGRVPFADSQILALCESLPARLKLGPEDGDLPGGKLVLRHAMRNRVPEHVLQRPKTSFPLPFQAWIADTVKDLEASRFAREILRPEIIADLVRDPVTNWQVTWPVLNLAHWGDRWFEGTAA